MKDYSKLIQSARQAIDKGFYANAEPQRKYGAAVLTRASNIYSAGQYSSFNHITSVHAEMVAVIAATMNGEPEITAISLASNVGEGCLSCGVCLQFLKEHCMRTGIDMDVIYAGDEREEIYKISKLTEKMW